MNTRELVEGLRDITYHITFTKGKELVTSAADKIEQLQQFIDDSTNDHYVDILDFYMERCQNLEEDFMELVMQSSEICSYCKHKIECKGEECPKYIKGRGCWDDKRCHHDWVWSCKDFEFGTCDMLENTPCNGCMNNDNKGFEWRGNNV